MIRKFWRIRIGYDLLNHLGNYMMQFQLSSRKNTGNEMTESLRLEFWEKFFSKQFCFIRSRRLNLMFVRKRRYCRFTFVENTIRKLSNLGKAKFLESHRMFHFISISKFGSFNKLLVTTTSLFELHFRCRRVILLLRNKISDFYELQQHQKQLKTMEMNEARRGIYYVEVIHQFQSGPTHKIQNQQRKHQV